MTPRHVRTFTTGAVASIALAVTGTALLSSGQAPTATSRLERSAVSEAGPTTVAPDQSGAAGQRGQSVGAGLRDKALRTAVLTDIPPSALAAYQRAASSLAAADPGCHLSWSTLAAIGQVESNHGRSTSRNARGIVGVPLNGNGVKAVADTDAGALDGDTKHDRAVGPMQILPSTWAAVAVDGDGDGKRDPQDIDDAALAAAVYLCGSGADMATPAGQQAALRSYNDSASYVTLVQSVARSYAKDQKAQYSIGSLQTGGIDYSAVSIGNVGTDADVTPAKKTKAAKKATATPTTPAATPTKTPAKTPTTGTTPTPTGGATPTAGTPTPTPTGTPTPTPAPAATPTPAPTGTPTPDPTPAPTPAPTTYDMVMPDVVTAPHTVEQAKSEVTTAAGAAASEAQHVGTVTITYVVIEDFDPSAPAGQVISTDPVKDTHITTADQTVTIHVSKGPDPATQPTATPSPAGP